MQELWREVVPWQDISNELLGLWYEGLCDAVVLGDKNEALAEASADYRQGWIDGVELLMDEDLEWML